MVLFVNNNVGILFLTSVGGLFRSITNTLGLTDSIARIYTGIRTTSDPVDITFTITRQTFFSRLITTIAGILDSVLATVYTGGTAFFRSIFDSLDISTALTRAIRFFRDIITTESYTTTINIIGQYIRTATQTLGISDLINRATSFFRSSSATESYSDSLSRQTFFSRVISNTVGIIISSLTKILTYGRFLYDSIGISDLFHLIGQYIRTTTQTLGSSDSIQRVISFFRANFTTESYSTSTTRQTFFSRVITNAVGITHAVLQRIVSFFRIASNLVGITTNYFHLTFQFVRNLSNTILITETLNRVTSFFRSSTASVSISDALTRLKTIFRALSNSMGITTATVRIISFFRLISNYVIITELNTRVIAFFRSLSTTASNTVSIFRQTVFSRAITITLGITHTIVPLKTMFYYLYDTLSNSLMLVRTTLHHRLIEISEIITETPSRIISFFRNLETTLDSYVIVVRNIVFFRFTDSIETITSLLERITYHDRDIHEHMLSLSNQIQMFDVVATINYINRRIRDRVSILFTFVKRTHFTLRNITDVVNIYSSIRAHVIGIIQILLTDAVQIINSNTISSVIIQRLITDGIGITIGITFGFIALFIRYVYDNVDMLSTFVNGGLFLKRSVESFVLNISQIPKVSKSIVRTLRDTVVPLFRFNKRGHPTFRFINDIVNIYDTIIARSPRVIEVFIQDIVSIFSKAERYRPRAFTATISDTITTTDSILIGPNVIHVAINDLLTTQDRRAPYFHVYKLDTSLNVEDAVV
jgi:hypothetical protein